MTLPKIMKADQSWLLCIKPEKPLFKLRNEYIEQRLLEYNKILIRLFKGQS